MTPRSLSSLALVTVLCAACNGTKPRSERGSPTPEIRQGEASGADHGFPDPQTYAQHLDDPGRDQWQKPKEVLRLLECLPGMTAVDLGAGTGYFIDYLSQAVGPEGRVLALDPDRSMIDALYERIAREGLQNVRPEKVAPDDPALALRSVDRVLVVNTWHHISKRVGYARKLLSALRPGGLLLIVDFTMDSPEGPPPHRRLTRDTVLRELETAGFAAAVIEESLPYQYAVAGRAP
ncbi:MAG: methyltransferase [Polyangiales bacterium]